MRLSIAAVGSRGDIQPYLALGRGLKQAGYEVQLCADRLFEQLVTSSGLDYTPITAAPVDFMQENLSRQGGPVKLMSWLRSHFNPLAREFFATLEHATRGTDAILYSTLAFAGYHVAQKHNVPSLAIYNVPITPTHEFQSLSFPVAPDWMPFKPLYNWWSFRLSNQLFIRLIKGIVNECRSDVLGIKPMPDGFYHRLDVTPLPMVYGFSTTLLPPPADWGDWVKVSGHWFMEDEPEWTPPEKLLHFIDAGKPPVYVGFGSMVDEQIERTTPIVLEALQRTGQRGILMGGWGGLGKGKLPESILHLDAAPHSWLFPRMAVVVHHGGAGTTATGLLYGRPTVIVPFFADQPFWGERVFKLGAGPRPIPFAKLSVKKLAVALEQAVSDPSMCENARQVGEKLQREDGVGKAVGHIQAYLENRWK